MTPKASLVFTTINDPIILRAYYENFRKYGRLDDVSVIVIPDNKTPKSAYATCNDLAKMGLKVRFITIEEQEIFLKKIGFRSRMIPYNSDNRRNVGFLLAFEEGSDFLISIDDDNYLLPDDDFIKEHGVVINDKVAGIELESSNGWYNICDLLTFESPDSTTYPRGFPYYARQEKAILSKKTVSRDVYVNAGLWLGDPDVNAISWLEKPVHSLGWTGDSLILSPHTWTPINTQNTALRHEAILAYYYIKMGYHFGGGAIDRYGDIFSGFFLEACAHHLGHGIRVGSPCAQHIRNSHNYLKDAQQELYCIVISEDLMKWLHDVNIEGSTYAEAYESLSFLLEDAVESFTSYAWDESVRAYFHQCAYHMRAWIKACNIIEK